MPQTTCGLSLPHQDPMSFAGVVKLCVVELLKRGPDEVVPAALCRGAAWQVCGMPMLCMPCMACVRTHAWHAYAVMGCVRTQAWHAYAVPASITHYATDAQLSLCLWLQVHRKVLQVLGLVSHSPAAQPVTRQMLATWAAVCNAASGMKASQASARGEGGPPGTAGTEGRAAISAAVAARANLLFPVVRAQTSSVLDATHRDEDALW